MSNEMIERVAKVMCTNRKFVCLDCKAAAKAAIEAIREPTDVMLKSALNLEVENKRKLNYIESYQAMIDAALKDG